MPLRQGQSRMKVGPVVDTAANVSVVTARVKRDKKYLQHVSPLKTQEVVKSAEGTTTIKEAGALQVGTITIPKVVPMEQSPVSVDAEVNLGACNVIVHCVDLVGLRECEGGHKL